MKEQQELRDRIDMNIDKGRNMLLTGPAGTGKSYNIDYIQKQLKDKGLDVVLTSTTGISAININGITAHRFFGSLIHNDITAIPQITSNFMFNSARQAMRETDVVIIDEISMVTSSLFELWDNLAKIARRSSEPFGGLQVILSGDFLQLPPVITDRLLNKEDWVFNSQTWSSLKLDTIFLNKVYRQDNIDFIHHLSRIRLGFPNEDTHKLLNDLTLKTPEEDVTTLTATNNEARAINEFKLSLLKTKQKTYNVTFKGNRKQAEKLLKDLPVDETIILKEGAMVLITVNDTAGGYANGTKGKVLEVLNSSVKLELENGKEIILSPYTWNYTTLSGAVKASVVQLPIKLAWAITIHKSQGMTIDGLHIQCDKIFEKAQMYVAISRAKNLDNLSLSDYSPKLIMVNDDAREFYRRK